MRVLVVSTALVLAAVMHPPVATAAPARGFIVAVGGGVTSPEIAAEIRKRAGGDRARLVIVPTGHRDAAAAGELIARRWRARGFGDVTVMHARSRREANRPDFARGLRRATAVWLAGGSQTRIAARYRGTRFARELRALLDRGGVVAGSSAGAAVMSRRMIRAGNPIPRMGIGLGLVDNAIIDQHFVVRRRAPRLRRALRRYRNRIGYGIPESTALVFEGTKLLAIGASDVIVLTSHMPATAKVILRRGKPTTVTELRARATKAATAALPELVRIEGSRATVVLRGRLRKRRAVRAERHARAVYADFESRLAGPRPRKRPPPIDVVLFARTRDYRNFMRGVTGSKPYSDNGMYMGAPRLAIANLARGMGNLRHEMVHGLIGDDFPSVPAWLNEGIGALYGSVALNAAGKVRFLVNYRLRDLQRALRSRAAPDLSALAGSSSRQVYGERSWAYYATARYVMLHLYRRKQLGAFYAAMRDRQPRTSAESVLERFVTWPVFVSWAHKLRR